MNTIFKNDPLAMIWEAFKNLYPEKAVEKPIECYWYPGITDETGERVKGVTVFSDDITTIYIEPQLQFSDAVEVFAHELAHIIAGIDADHGPEWKKHFTALADEYARIGAEKFDFSCEVE